MSTCEKHDNWHAHCQQCCQEEISELKYQLEANERDFQRRQAAHKCNTWDDGAGACNCEERFKELEWDRAHLSNLLARIHRDGGHYEVKHGLEKAVRDADERLARMNIDIDDAQKALKNGIDDEVWKPGESAVQALIRQWRRQMERAGNLSKLLEAVVTSQELKKSAKQLREELGFKPPEPHECTSCGYSVCMCDQQ